MGRVTRRDLIEHHRLVALRAEWEGVVAHDGYITPISISGQSYRWIIDNGSLTGREFLAQPAVATAGMQEAANAGA
jgi:hypothetical protein